MQPKELPTYVGLTDPGEFIVQATPSQRMHTLETALGATAVGRTDNNKTTPSWAASQKFLRLSFITQVQAARRKFIGPNSPQTHLRHSYAAWDTIPREERVHKFVHTLEPLAQKWYMEVAL